MTLSSSAIHSLSGAISGFASCFAVQPLDVLKTRLQQPISIQPSNGTSTLLSGKIPLSSTIAIQSKTLTLTQVSKKIYQEHGWPGFWRGTAATLVRNVPGSSLYFLALEYCRSFLSYTMPSASPYLIHLSSGAIARGWVGLLMMPASVIKTRFESSLYHYPSIWGAFRDICAKEGIKGLFAGFGVTSIRDVPFAGIYLMCYEYSKNHIRISDWSTRLNQTTSAISAGVIATIITQPFDLIKTKVQIAPSKYPNSWIAAKELFQSRSINGFFTGLAPRLARKPLHAAITWTIYEESVKFLKILNENVE